jgi:uncharacterized protein YneF (UPF0154 family)
MTFETILIIVLLLILAFSGGGYVGYRYGKRVFDNPNT